MQCDTSFSSHAQGNALSHELRNRLRNSCDLRAQFQALETAKRTIGPACALSRHSGRRRNSMSGAEGRDRGAVPRSRGNDIFTRCKSNAIVYVRNKVASGRDPSPASGARRANTPRRWNDLTPRIPLRFSTERMNALRWHSSARCLRHPPPARRSNWTRAFGSAFPSGTST